jgi:hypothetical protein
MYLNAWLTPAAGVHRSSYVQQKFPQAALAIDEHTRQPQSVIRRPRHTRQDSDCRGVAGPPHQLNSIVGEVPERIGEMLDRDAEHVAQSNPTLRDLVPRRVRRQFVQPRMRTRVRADLHPGSQPFIELPAAHQRFCFLQILRIPAVVSSESAAYYVTRGPEAIALHKRCRLESVGVPIIKGKRDAAACGAIAQPRNAFTHGDATQAETAQRPQLSLEFIRAHVQQLEARPRGRQRHVVIAENGKYRHDR